MRDGPLESPCLSGGVLTETRLGFGQESLRKLTQSFQSFEIMVAKTCCVSVLALCVAVLAGALQDGVGSLPHQSWSIPACQEFSGVSEKF